MAKSRFSFPVQRKIDSYQPVSLELEERLQGFDGVQPNLNIRQRPTKLTPSAWFSSISRGHRTFWTRTRDDLGTIRWRSTLPFLAKHVLPISLIATCLAGIIVMATIGTILYMTPVCLPDGTVNSKEEGYSPWPTSELFTINIGFGSLPFKQAKLIDLTWDLVVGRGGQALMVLISYCVTTSSLTRLMESYSVPCDTFEAVTLQAHSLIGFTKLVRSSLNRQPARSSLITFTILLTSAIVLLFPTFASAMAGYSANFDAEFQLSNGSSISVDGFQRVWYIIHDGYRLGPNFYENYLVVDYTPKFPGTGNAQRWKFSNDSQNLGAWEDSRAYWMFGCADYAPGQVYVPNDTVIMQSVTGTPRQKFSTSNLNVSQCILLWQLSNYSQIYGLMGQQNISSTLYDPFTDQDIQLPSPTLNVTMFMPALFQEYQSDLRDLFERSSSFWAVIPFGTSWYVNNHINVDNLKCPLVYQDGHISKFVSSDTFFDNVTCRQQSLGDRSAVTYMWGFAYQSLFYCCILLFIWAVATYGLYVDALLYLRMPQRTQGLHRATLDIVSAHQSDLLEKDTRLSSNDELSTIFQGHSISFEKMPIGDVKPRQARLAEWWRTFDIADWARHEWPWLTGLSLCTILAPISMWTYARNPYWDSSEATISARPLNYILNPAYWPILWSGVFAVLVAGKGHFSRWILFVAFTTVYLVIHLVWCFTSIPW